MIPGVIMMGHSDRVLVVGDFKTISASKACRGIDVPEGDVEMSSGKMF
jgi:hypothetical protein